MSPRQSSSQKSTTARNTTRSAAALQLSGLPPSSPVRNVSGGSMASVPPSSSFDSSSGPGLIVDINIDDIHQHYHHDRIEEHRERNGLCIKCGQRLFDMGGKNNHNKGRNNNRDIQLVKTPLTIPGMVERGQCLVCARGGGVNGGGTNTIATASPELVVGSAGGGLSPGSVGSGVTTTSTVTTPVSYGDDHTNVEGVPNGGQSVVLGALTTAGGSGGGGRTSYQGEFNVYGERDGTGTMKWENGDSYTGAFFNGNRHGTGTLYFADGSEYVGEWECNLQHGVGTRRWTNGDCYTGQYLNGKRTGEGRFYFANGDMYTGQWNDGVMEGFGRYYYNSGQRFEGNFRDGKRRGKGKLQRTDGSVDIGVYHRDVRVGLGVRWNADRTVAWKMLDGTLRKKISIAEAVAMDYDIDAAVQALDQMEQQEPPQVV
jgi:hypothetical protein